jgi:hypothetical protein
MTSDHPYCGAVAGTRVQSTALEPHMPLFARGFLEGASEKEWSVGKARWMESLLDVFDALKCHDLPELLPLKLGTPTGRALCSKQIPVRTIRSHAEELHRGPHPHPASFKVQHPYRAGARCKEQLAVREIKGDSASLIPRLSNGIATWFSGRTPSGCGDIASVRQGPVLHRADVSGNPRSRWRPCTRPSWNSLHRFTLLPTMRADCYACGRVLMATGRSPAKQHVDRDGVRTEISGVRRSVWLLALAMAAVGVALFVVLRPVFEQALNQPPGQRAADLAATSPPLHPTAAAQKPPAPTTRARILGPPRVADAQSRPEPKQPPQAAPAPAAAPVFDATPAPAPETDSDQPSGIALFPPPGTNPIKRGIIVPDGFELPPGYVRHYQTTDDGYQLPPILMFDEDYRPVDEHGEPIPLPDDRVVPPEMAPPGLAVQILNVPERNMPGSAGSGEGEPQAQAPPQGGIRHRQ